MKKISAPKTLAATALTALLAACASQESAAPNNGKDPTAIVVDAAQAPLSDLNLVQQKIPSVLQAAASAPYTLPSVKTCPAIANEVQALDAALGADLDTPPTPNDPGLLERGSNALLGAAGDALHGAAESVIPFRGWLRKLDGAERHSKAVAAAIAAGSVRRAYLKGVGQELGCLAPAAPRAASGNAPASGPSR